MSKKSKKSAVSPGWNASKIRITHLAIFLFGIVLYANTIGHSYNLDDELVTRNHRLTSQGVKAIPEIFTSPYYEDAMGYAYEYRPIVLASFAIEHEFFGDNPKTSHFINVLLYGLTGLILFILMSRLFPEVNILFPLTVSLLFIAHPLHTEVVSSIKNRDDILAWMAGMGAWLFAIAYSKTNKFSHVLITTLLFFTAILSKLSVFPLVLLIPVSLIMFSHVRAKQLIILSSLMTLSSIYFIPILLISHKIFLSALLIFFPAALKIKTGSLTLKIKKYYRKFLPSPPATGALENEPRKFYSSRVHPNVTSIYFSLGAILIGGVNYFALLFNFHHELIFVVSICLLSAYLLFYNYPPIAFLWYPALIALLFFLYRINVRPLELLIMFYTVLFFNSEKTAKVYIMTALLGLAAFRTITIPSITPIFQFLPQLGVGFLYNRMERKWAKYLSLIFIGFCAFQVGLVFFHLLRENSDSAYRSLKTIGEVLIPSIVFLFAALLHFHKFKPAKYAILTTFTIGILYYFFFTEKMGYGTPVHQEALAFDKTAENFYTTDRPINHVELPLRHDSPLEEKMSMASKVMLRYLKLAFLPYPMSFYYGYNCVPVSGIDNIESIISIAIHLVLLVVAVLSIRKHPILSFGIFVYLGSIIMFSNLFSLVAGIMADRFTYAASAGFCMGVAYLLMKVFKIDFSVNEPLKLKRGFTITVGLILVSYSYLTITRNVQWKNSLILMRHDIRHLGNSAQAHNLLASNLMKYSYEKEYAKEALAMRQEALPYFRRALEIYPKFFNAWYDLGRTYLILNQPDSALQCFIKVHEMDSTFSDATLSIASIAEQKEDYDMAIKYYERVIAINPYLEDTYSNLSYLYFRLNQPEKSIETNRKAIAYNPAWKHPYENIARVYFSLGDSLSAHDILRKAPR